MVLKGASEIAAGMTAQVPQVHADCDRCAAQIVVGAPLGPTNRWRPYAVAMIDQAIRRHPGMDLYAARLRAPSIDSPLPAWRQGMAIAMTYERVLVGSFIEPSVAALPVLPLNQPMGIQQTERRGRFFSRMYLMRRVAIS